MGSPGKIHGTPVSTAFHAWSHSKSRSEGINSNAISSIKFEPIRPNLSHVQRTITTINSLHMNSGDDEVKTINKLQTTSRPRWVIARVFGKTHWCTPYVNALCEARPDFLLHLSDQSCVYVHYLCLVRLKWGEHEHGTPAIEEQAEILLRQPKKKVLARLYKPCPQGLLNVLPRLGERPLTNWITAGWSASSTIGSKGCSWNIPGQ